MREIKFRVFVKEGDSMFVNYSNDYFVSSDGVLNYYNGDELSNVGQEENIISQFTGLYDRNGKEIYEGDIVEDQSGNLWEVYFDMGQFLLKDNIVLHTPISLYAEPIKVVRGNIYENPELLDKLSGEENE